MNGSPVATLVRGWVDLYTRGLPADLRDARRDEVADDLWCEQDEAAAAGRSARSLDADLFRRLVFGMPADVSWRLAYRRAPTAASLARSSSMSTRALGTLAIMYGLSLGDPVGPVRPGWAGGLVHHLRLLRRACIRVGAIAFSATVLGLVRRFE